MEDDMLKTQRKVVDISCNLELIYPPAFFDIMIHMVIHLPLEALEGGPIHLRWMFPFENFMKKLKGYIQNKAKLEGSIAEGYVVEEALTFSSHYFRDVTTKFNRPERNFDKQELKKVIWYVLHNRPEIDTYRSKFKNEFYNKDMKDEFSDWFGSQICQRHIDKDPGVNVSSELFDLACGPTPTPISVNSCVVNDVRFVMHNYDECRTTQNSGICSPGGKDEEMYYEHKVKHLVLRNNMTQIWAKGKSFKDDQHILATQVKQVFYLEDMARRPPNWKVVEHVNHKKFLNGGVIVVEDDPDVIHFDNSSDLALSTNIIIDVDEDDDIIDDEGAIPYDLVYSDDEDLANMSSDVAQGHGGNGGGDDRLPPHQIPTGCGGCLVKGTRKPNLGGWKAGRLHTRQKTQNLGLKKITDLHGLVPIRFEWNDKETLTPLDVKRKSRSAIVTHQMSNR
nr:hypothetical protein [Tanacetum cinerariifolium]